MAKNLNSEKKFSKPQVKKQNITGAVQKKENKEKKTKKTFTQAKPTQQLQGVQKFKKFDKNSENSKVKNSGDKDSIRSRKERRQEKWDKKIKKSPIYGVVKEIIKDWELLRPHTAKKAQKQLIVQKILDKIGDKYMEFAMKKESCRILQSCYKYGDPQQKAKILEKCGQFMVELSLHKYGCFLARAIVNNIEEIHLIGIAKLLQGNVGKLLKHSSGSAVIDDLYTQLNAKLKDQFVMELYNEEFKMQQIEQRNFDDVWKNSTPFKKNQTIKYMTKQVLPLLEKRIVEPAVVHRIASEFMEHASVPLVEECVDNLSDGNILKVIHTNQGAKLMSYIIQYSSPKQRKNIVKGVKGHVKQSIIDQWGRSLILAIFKYLDDTVIVKKTILPDIQADLLDIIQNQYAFVVVLYLLRNGDEIFFPQSLKKILEPGRILQKKLVEKDPNTNMELQAQVDGEVEGDQTDKRGARKQGKNKGKQKKMQDAAQAKDGEVDTDMGMGIEEDFDVSDQEFDDLNGDQEENGEMFKVKGGVNGGLMELEEEEDSEDAREYEDGDSDEQDEEEMQEGEDIEEGEGDELVSVGGLENNLDKLFDDQQNQEDSLQDEQNNGHGQAGKGGSKAKQGKKQKSLDKASQGITQLKDEEADVDVDEEGLTSGSGEIVTLGLCKKPLDVKVQELLGNQSDNNSFINKIFSVVQDNLEILLVNPQAGRIIQELLLGGHEGFLIDKLQLQDEVSNLQQKTIDICIQNFERHRDDPSLKIENDKSIKSSKQQNQDNVLLLNYFTTRLLKLVFLQATVSEDSKQKQQSQIFCKAFKEQILDMYMDKLINTHADKYIAVLSQSDNKQLSRSLQKMIGAKISEPYQTWIQKFQHSKLQNQNYKDTNNLK